MSLATICRQVAVLVGVAPADAWIGNDDTAAIEIVAWVNEAQQRVADDGDWSHLVATQVLVCSGADVDVQTQPDNLQRYLPDTAWVGPRAVEGPLDEAEWARRVAGASDSYSLRGGQGINCPAWALRDGALFLLQCPAGETFTVEYVTALPELVSDAQVSALGLPLERVVTLCAIALYRDAKGLPAGSASQQYLSALAQAKAKDRPVGALSMARRRARGGSRGVETTFILDGGSRMT